MSNYIFIDYKTFQADDSEVYFLDCMSECEDYMLAISKKEAFQMLSMLASETYDDAYCELCKTIAERNNLLDLVVFGVEATRFDTEELFSFTFN